MEDDHRHALSPGARATNEEALLVSLPAQGDASQSTAHKQIVALDLIRLAAAIVVMVYHLAYKAWAVPTNPVHQLLQVPAVLPPWWAFSWWGWVGVQIFFVLSGVVIAQSARGASASGFVRRRALRLVPAMWIAVIIAGGVSVALKWLSAGLVLGLGLKTAVFFPVGPWLIGQAWTLPIEISFYAIIAVLVLTNQLRHVRVLAACLAFASLCFLAASQFTHGLDSHGRLAELLLLQHGGYFALGIVFAEAAGGRIRRADWLIIATCVVAAWLQISAAAIAEHPGFGLERRYLAPFLLWLGCVALIGCAWRLNQWLGAMSVGVRKAIRTGGLVTYPLYLVHIHVGAPVLIWLAHAGFPPYVAILAAFAAATLTAIAVTLVLEPPLRGLLNAATKRIGVAALPFLPHALYRRTAA